MLLMYLIFPQEVTQHYKMGYKNVLMKFLWYFYAVDVSNHFTSMQCHMLGFEKVLKKFLQSFYAFNVSNLSEKVVHHKLGF